MTFKSDITRRAAVAEFANALAACPPSDEFAVEIGSASLCPHTVVPIVALLDEYRRNGGRVTISAPDGSEAAVLAHTFNCGSLSPDPVRGVTSPFGRVWRFSAYDEQTVIVNAMILALSESALMGRGVKDSLTWCINEVMDNVLTHAQPGGGGRGYVMVRLDGVRNRLKACVFDLGVGLKDSFAGSAYSPADDYEAIVLALKAGVTSGLGQGNGLWGLHEIVRRAKGGSVSVVSGSAGYLFAPGDGANGPVALAAPPGVTGSTLVDFRLELDGDIDYDRIFGNAMPPVDLWQENHETANGAFRYGVLEICGGTGTRLAAARLRHLVENTIENDRKNVEIDFSGVNFCSSAFIDEIVGKLLLKYGFLAFMERIRLVNVRGLSAQLVNHSIYQRMAEAANLTAGGKTR